MYNKDYDIVEYSTDKYNRHVFRKKSESPSFKVTDKDVFRSIYLHSDDIITYYNTHLNEQGNKTIAGYSGNVKADNLSIDIDDEDLNQSLLTTKDFVRYLQNTYELDPSYLQYKFSGSKGFHITIPAELFGGFESSELLPEIHKNIVTSISDGFAGIDTSIYRTTGLIRLENTINSKSGLYAIPLEYTELFKYSIEEIKALAVKSRTANFIDPDELLENKELAELKNKASVIKSLPKQRIKKTVPEIWGSQSAGGRHKGAGTIIGYLGLFGVPNESIRHIVQLWNKSNTPPKTEEEIDKDVSSFLATYGREEKHFWTIKKLESGWDVKINFYDYLKFLEQHGFAKKHLDKSYFFVRVQDNIVEEITLEKIKDFILDYIRSFYSDTSVYGRELLNHLYSKSSYYFGEKLIECIPSIELGISTDQADTSNFYFRNGFVTVNPQIGITLHPYSELPGRIWKSHIIQRDFYTNSEGLSIYEQFLYNVSGKSADRLKTIRSAVGYLLHSYKDSANAKVVVLVDEKIPKNGEPNGRTGKSIFGRALSKLKTSSRIDGKNFTFTDRFTFQQVYLDTKIMEFNDVKKNFDFERLFSVTTDDMTIENKGEKPYTLKFEDSPKILVSTNYTIKGQGASFEDRLFEVEFSDHYNQNHKPLDDFTKRFFEEWDQDEWSRFDNFMLECVCLYLKEGLIAYKTINLEKRKLMDETSPEFVEFAENKIKIGIEYDKHTLFIEFREEYTDFTQIYQRTFTNWTRLYAGYLDVDYNDRKSSGSGFFTLEDFKLRGLFD